MAGLTCWGSRALAGRLLGPRLLLARSPAAAGAVGMLPFDAAAQLQRQQGSGGSAASAARRAIVCSSSSSGSSQASEPTAAEPAGKKRVVFCGTPEVSIGGGAEGQGEAVCAAASCERLASCRRPSSTTALLNQPAQVAALVLKRLLAAAAAPDSTFEVAAVVTQPPRPTGRGNRKVPQPSPVALAAAEAGLPPERVLSPERPGEAGFLDALRQLSPDLCVTAAYGNYLPSSFLAVPPHGTLNIHPSLLPAYRGAAPVQRALQDGLAVTGVTVLYTVKAMDAGPVLAQKKLPVRGPAGALPLSACRGPQSCWAPRRCRAPAASPAPPRTSLPPRPLSRSTPTSRRPSCWTPCLSWAPTCWWPTWRPCGRGWDSWRRSRRCARAHVLRALAGRAGSSAAGAGCLRAAVCCSRQAPCGRTLPSPPPSRRPPRSLPCAMWPRRTRPRPHTRPS